MPRRTSPLFRTLKISHRRRKGAVLVLSALLMIVLLGMVAFAVDTGTILIAKSEAQRCADAAALAAAWEMVSDERLEGYENSVEYKVRLTAWQYARKNKVANRSPWLWWNVDDSLDGDIVTGRLSDPNDLNETMVTNSPAGDNAVTVRVRMFQSRNRAIPVTFGRLLGVNAADVSAEATAIFDDNVIGFGATEDTGNSGLLPFVVHVDTWKDLMDGLSGEDNWSYDPETGEVTEGSDGIPEIDMYPGGGESGNSNGNGNGNGNGNNNGNGQNQVAPGNFGTVDIGNTNNSANDLKRQIEFGPNENDFSYYDDGKLQLDPGTQTLELNGDTGLTASMKSALGKIVGDGRTIMLYESVSGNGNNAMFTIVGFAGIRVMDFSMTGGDKYIHVQPSMVTDPTAITGDYGESYFVGQPVRLVR
jgi:hypothetical protein